jgi:hypothetical protein
MEIGRILNPRGHTESMREHTPTTKVTAPPDTQAPPGGSVMAVSLAEALWRTRLTSTIPEMRTIALEAGALLPGDLVDLTRFLGSPAPVPLTLMNVTALT